MNLPDATIIGTRMPIEDISKYLGYTKQYAALIINLGKS